MNWPYKLKIFNIRKFAKATKIQKELEEKLKDGCKISDELNKQINLYQKLIGELK